MFVCKFLMVGKFGLNLIKDEFEVVFLVWFFGVLFWILEYFGNREMGFGVVMDWVCGLGIDLFIGLIGWVFFVGMKGLFLLWVWLVWLVG